MENEHATFSVPLTSHRLVGGTIPIVTKPDTTVSPAKDFYKYINNPWQKRIRVPPYLGSYGVSEEIETEVRVSLIKVIEVLRETKPKHPISALATSFLNSASQKSSVTDLQHILNSYDCVSNAKEVCSTIGKLNRIQCGSPLSLVIGCDTYDSSKPCVYLYEPSTGLPENQHYVANAQDTILLKYRKLLNTVGDLMNIDTLESAITIEAGIIPYLSSNDELSDIRFSYSPHSYSNLVKTYNNVDWAAMFDEWGVTKDVYTKANFVVTNRRYMLLFNKMFRTFTIETWRKWFQSLTILNYMEYLPSPFSDLHFDLYGKALRGNEEKLPQKWVTLKVLQTFATQDLGKLFVKMSVANGTKKVATKLIQELKDATVERLTALEWMESSTKAKAIRKVKAMYFQVAYPDTWDSETDVVTIDPNRPLTNIIHLAEYDTQRMIDELNSGCITDKKQWEDGAFEVNAYYYAESNRMVIPAGMLRAPFFDLSRSVAWNLGGIGAAIGHEITHGFDDEGRLYDENGSYKDWWTPHDTRKFKKLTQVLITLFDSVTYMGGKVDGRLTLSENLADLGGIAIALQALQNHLKKATDIEKKQAYIDFFTSFAVSWRNKDRPRKAKQSLLLDVHSPAPLRVNRIVKNFEEFYVAFDVKEGDAGFIPESERVKLW